MIFKERFRTRVRAGTFVVALSRVRGGSVLRAPVNLSKIFLASYERICRSIADSFNLFLISACRSGQVVGCLVG